MPDPETPAFEVAEPTYPAIKTDGQKTAREAATTLERPGASPSSVAAPVHGAPELLEGIGTTDGYDGLATPVDAVDDSKTGWFAYVRTRDFYIVLLLG